VNINWLEMLFTIFLASFGGIVNRLAAHERNPKSKIKSKRYVAAAVISLFVGIVAYFIFTEKDVALNLKIALTASAGFIGTPFIYWILKLIKKEKNLPDFDEMDGEMH